jgi:hypothetical protein
MPFRASNLGVDEWLPAIVLGRTLSAGDLSAVPPPCLFRIEHQYGGLLCCQVELVGAVMPLAPIRAASALLTGFEALGCDSPDGRLIRRHPELAPLHFSAGEPYNEDQLACLRGFLGQAPALRLPTVLGGYEALVDLDPAWESVRSLEGLPVLSPEIAPGVGLLDEDATDAVMGPVGLHQGTVLTRSLYSGLSSWLRAPRLLLLWGNSD